MLHGICEKLIHRHPHIYGDVKVQNEEGKGLMIIGVELLNFSLHKFTSDNLDGAVYTYQLKEADN